MNAALADRREVVDVSGVRLSRRALLGVSGAAMLGTLLASDGWLASPTYAAAPAASGPRVMHTASSLQSVAKHVAAGDHPWVDGWNRLVANGRSHSTWNPRPLTTVVRGGAGQNVAQLFYDVHAAYQNALRWHISGDTANADCAVKIMNAWSSNLQTVTGNADRFLAAGIQGYQFAVAADLMAGYPGFDVPAFQKMLLNVFYPLNNDFLVHHNGAAITNYWANWDLCNMTSVLAIGVFCERQDLVDQAVTYFKTGAGNGSIEHAVPFVFPGGLGQWQESGRDQAHTTMGIGLMGAFCEIAWNQGLDLYGYDDNRFLKGAEYVAKYNLGHDVPFQTYTWYSGPGNGSRKTQTVISDYARGGIRPVWELVYNHYVRIAGLDAPNLTAMAALVRAEGGGGDYGPNSGGYDQLGFGTLLFTAADRPAPSAPATPPPGPSQAPAPTSTPTPSASSPGPAASSTQGTSASAIAAPASRSTPSPTPTPAGTKTMTDWGKRVAAEALAPSQKASSVNTSSGPIVRLSTVAGAVASLFGIGAAIARRRKGDHRAT